MNLGLEIGQLLLHELNLAQRSILPLNLRCIPCEPVSYTHLDVYKRQGIESTEQVDFLRSMGCDMIQGYVFSAPIPLKEFEKRYLQEQP